MFPQIESPYRVQQPSLDWRESTRGPRRPRQPPLRARELLSLVALVVLADVWFTQDSSILRGFALMLCPLLVWFGAQRPKVSLRAGALAAATFALAVRLMQVPSAWTLLFGLITCAAFAQAVRVQRVYVPEFLLCLVRTPTKLGRRIAVLAAGSRRLVGSKAARSQVLGAVLALAFLAFFCGTLSATNPTLRSLLGRALAAILSMLPTFQRAALWGAATLGGLTLLRPSVRRPFAWGVPVPSDDGVHGQRASELANDFFRFALPGLNALLLLHIATDLPYVWRFEAPPFVSTQEYAHTGALWLTFTLAALNASLGLLFRNGAVGSTSPRWARVLAYAALAQGFVVGLFVVARMVMHVQKAGLSNLHFVGFYGIALVLTGLALLAYKICRARSLAFLVRAQLDAAALVLVAFAVTPTYAISARVNVARIRAGDLTPALQLVEQAQEEESARFLVPLTHHEHPTIRHGVRALLEDHVLDMTLRRPSSSDIPLLTDALAKTAGDVTPKCTTPDGEELPERECARVRFAELRQELARLHGIDLRYARGY